MLAHADADAHPGGEAGLARALARRAARVFVVVVGGIQNAVTCVRRALWPEALPASPDP